ncbi:MAG: discoidin domain-containing protein, partial [Prevotellaceae bacterium]|jgi:hypothetical protein|nr:discoidin domain-containing protein [Prevotellaceae bacterium]
LTVYQTDPILSSIKINEIVPNTVLPNTTQQLDAQLFDQYGATMGGEVTWLVLENGSITQNGLFTAGTTLGVHARVVATNGNLKDTITLKINNLPVLQTAEIIPNLQYLEKGKTVNYTLQAIDQYNEPFEVTPDWEIIKSNNTVENSTNSKNYLFNKNEIGIYTIKAKVGTQEFTTEVYLAPPFANIALNKTTQASSYENAGTVKENVNDGDLATRWGSQHSDNQWIRVDLGTVAYISHVTLVWEAAYASLYEIQISDNGSAWTTIETIDGHGGAETTVINASARYVRMLGLQRASPYGYSIYEFQVFGVLPTSAQPALFGIDITPNLMQIKEGETQQLTAIGYDQFGNEFAITPQFSIFSGVGNINSSGLYSASAYGKATVQAKVGNKTATADFVIEETPKIRSLQIQPAKVQVVVGEGFTFAATASDQFECDFSADALNYYTTDANATMAGSTFSSEMPGDYLVVVQSGTIKDTAEVRVDYIANINLAFLKPVAATSYENAGTLPEYVNDGDPATRWGSAFSDPQTIEIDLLDVYKINKINLLWEAAYATRYRVEVSADEETWEAVYTENAGTGGAKMINFAETEARFVRVTTLARATQYGASLFEIEVYGTERVPTEITNVFNNNSDNIIIKNIGKKLMVEGENLQKISIYNIQGVLLNKFILKENKNYFETTINFADGIYLVVVKTNENQMVRKIIFK